MIKAIFLALSFTLLAGAGCKKNATDETLTKMEGFSKQVCACKDMACAKTVNDEMMKLLNAMGGDGANLTKEQAMKMDKIMSEMEACMDKLVAAPADGPEPITP